MKDSVVHEPGRDGKLGQVATARSGVDTTAALTPVVSVIIPVHNRPVAVVRAIESVLAQTYQNFEIIVVDDGSTDTTAAAVSAVGDQRIRLVRHQTKRGGSAARNAGIQAGSAPYVAFLDSDDEWFPTKLERQVELFERGSHRVGLVYTGAERVYEDGTVIRAFGRRYADPVRSLLIENVIGETSLGMVRRSALEITGGFDESLPSCQDIDLWLRICEHFEADAIPEPLVRVVKGNDVGRISRNVPRTVLGRDLYCQKHRDKMIHTGVIHLFLRESGWWQQRRVCDVRAARRLYLESLRYNALAPFTYVLLLATYLPLSWLDRLARSRHRLTGPRPAPSDALRHDSNGPTSAPKLQPNTPSDGGLG